MLRVAPDFGKDHKLCVNVETGARQETGLSRQSQGKIGWKTAWRRGSCLEDYITQARFTVHGASRSGCGYICGRQLVPLVTPLLAVRPPGIPVQEFPGICLVKNSKQLLSSRREFLGVYKISNFSYFLFCMNLWKLADIKMFPPFFTNFNH